MCLWLSITSKELTEPMIRVSPESLLLENTEATVSTSIGSSAYVPVS